MDTKEINKLEISDLGLHRKYKRHSKPRLFLIGGAILAILGYSLLEKYKSNAAREDEKILRHAMQIAMNKDGIMNELSVLETRLFLTEVGIDCPLDAKTENITYIIDRTLLLKSQIRVELNGVEIGQINRGRLSDYIKKNFYR